MSSRRHSLSEAAGLRWPLPRRRVPGFVPRAAIRAVQAFIQTEASGGFVLLAATVAAVVWANSPWDGSYAHLWHTSMTLDIGIVSITQDFGRWINDGLMTLFFFLMGLEIKREVVDGELREPRRAVLPVMSAFAGMAVPAAIYAAFNAGHEGAGGWGIPMATDIAFSLGLLSLLGRRAPVGLKVFLLTLAVTDDLGSIAIIALFYSGSISFGALAWAAGLFAAIVAMNRWGVRSIYVYAVAGALLWLAMAKSGVTPTLVGAVLGLMTPARPSFGSRAFLDAADALVLSFRVALEGTDRDGLQDALGQMEELSREAEAPLDRLERLLHPWVSFLIVPLFALANAGVHLSTGDISGALSARVGLGILAGRLAGKLAGIVGMSLLLVLLRVGQLPTSVRWSHMVGAGLVASVGFTVSLFVTDLAFEDGALVSASKIALFAASVIAGAAGYALLRVVGNGGETGG